jgi:hypothetical protein
MTSSLQPFMSIAMTSTRVLGPSDRAPELRDLETLGTQDQIETQSAQEHEAEVKMRLQSAITQDEEDRIAIPLPFICENVPPPRNKPVGKKRLDDCTGKLQQQEKLLQYSKMVGGRKGDWPYQRLLRWKESKMKKSKWTLNPPSASWWRGWWESPEKHRERRRYKFQSEEPKSFEEKCDRDPECYEEEPEDVDIPEDQDVVTRSGRKARKPQRYGKWNQ